MQVTTIVPRRGINDEGKGKKYALHKLISAADTEFVWLQDDDVVPPVATPETDADLLILPLRMESERDNPSILERLQIAEYAAIQQLTIVSAQRGRAVMCSGANMIVRRQCWLESYQDLHLDIPSGDDMFLLESFKRRSLRIEVADVPQYTAVVRPETSWRAFWRQRMRWAGKAPHYTDSDIIRCGTLVATANVAQVLCPAVLLVKFPIEYTLIKKRDPKVSLFTAVLLELLYPWYMLVCLVGGLLRRSW